MAKLKTKGINGYGLKSPWSKEPGDQDRRAGNGTGMGDYYGTGFRNKIGRIRDTFGSKPVSESGLKKPPKSLT